MPTLRALKDRNLAAWVGPWVRHVGSELVARQHRGTRHLLFALCDHFEPQWGQPDPAQADARVTRWHRDLPGIAGKFRDCHGRPPRHTFFFPGEEYRPAHLEQLADLTRSGLGEVELHLHHDGDTPETLRAQIAESVRLLASHGHFSRQGKDGRCKFAFIHGNWCLANARNDGRHCGVDAELPILFDSGCYADFTFPAAPNESQPPIVNAIYWPTGDLARRRAQDTGQLGEVGTFMDDRLLIIQGPLGFVPRLHRLPVRIENGNLADRDRVNETRVRSWVRANIHIRQRPEWVFVKVHTHGAAEKQADYLLGEGGITLHRLLTRMFNDGENWRLHYVTAREMYNVAAAAMDGRTGDPADYYDYRLTPPPAAPRSM